MGGREIQGSWELSIDRAPAEVFGILVDFERYLAQWAQGPVSAEKVTPGEIGGGTRFVVTAKLVGLPVRSPYLVTNFERERRFGGDGVAGPVRFSEEYRLDADGERGSSTKLRYTMRARPRGPFRIVEGPISSHLRKLIGADLGRFKALVERERSGDRAG